MQAMSVSAGGVRLGTYKDLTYPNPLPIHDASNVILHTNTSPPWLLHNLPHLSSHALFTPLHSNMHHLRQPPPHRSSPSSHSRAL
jgi:hypothetical protein